MSMKLYDKDIACVMQNIKAYGECRRLDNNAHWKMNDKEKLVQEVIWHTSLAAE